MWFWARSPCCIKFVESIAHRVTVLHQGKVVGYVTSAYFGHTIGKQLAYAWVPAELSTQGTGLSIRYFDRDYPATVGPDPQYDPQMKRLRS